MATIICRALTAVKWHEVSRVLSVSSTLITTKSYHTEIWCKRWTHIPQRNFSITSRFFVPSLSPMLAKRIDDLEASSKEKSLKSTKEVESNAAETAEDVAAEVIVTYQQGLLRFTIPLPSKKENCVLILKPYSHTVGDLIRMLKEEDRGIDQVDVKTTDGTKIGSCNDIESLIGGNFRLIINDVDYSVIPQLLDKFIMNYEQKISDIRMIAFDLYKACHIQNLKKEIMAELETIEAELKQLEQQLQELMKIAKRKADYFVWFGLFFVSIQVGCLARLTWWEYSWDIMEPVTYFLTYVNTLLLFVFFVLTKQEYILSNVINRRCLVSFYKIAKKTGFDVEYYNSLKDRAYELETALKIICGPLYKYQNLMMEERRERSSSSSSRSPSSSPSPSPSPDRSLSKKDSRKPNPEKTRSSSHSTDKSTKDY